MGLIVPKADPAQPQTTSTLACFLLFTNWAPGEPNLRGVHRFGSTCVPEPVILVADFHRQWLTGTAVLM